MMLFCALLAVLLLHGVSLAAYYPPPPQGIIYNPYPYPYPPSQPPYYPQNYYAPSAPYNPYPQASCTDDGMRRHINRYRQGTLHINPVSKSPSDAGAADQLCACLRQYDPPACQPPPRSFFGYITAANASEALKRIADAAARGGNVDEAGQPILSVEQRPLKDVISEGAINYMQGAAAFDPRYQRYVYVITYGY